MKRLLFIILVITSFLFIGCNNQKENNEINDNQEEINDINDDIKEIEEVIYIITFDISKCDEASGNQVLEIKDISELVYPEVTKIGYELIGWSPVIEEITSDITLSPIFEIIKFNVRLYDFNNEIYDELIYEYGSSLGILPYEELDDKVFLGYYNNDVEVSEDITIYSDMDLYSLYIDKEIYNIEKKIEELENNLDYELLVEIKEDLLNLDLDKINDIENIDVFYKREKRYLNKNDLEDEIYLTNWVHYVSKYNYPTSGLKKKYSEMIDILFNLTIDRDITSGNFNREQVVLASAKAVMNKGNLNQYNQTRRCTGFSPYDATIYDTLYMDCSAYSDAIYKYVLNDYNFLGNTNGICNYAMNHQNSVDVIYYIENNNISSDKEAILLSEIYNNLRPGDIIAYRHGKTSGNLGHVMLYLGNGLIIHSTGDDIGDISYDGNPDNYLEVQTSTEKRIGTVFTFNASELFFEKNSGRYLFRKSTNDSVFRFCVIRPLNKYNQFTDKALSQYLLEDIDISKTSSASSRTGIGQNEVVEFTITLTNYSNRDVNNIPIYQELSNCYDVLDWGNGYIEDNKLYYSISIKAYETVRVSYKVKPKQVLLTTTLTDGLTHILDITLGEITNTLCIDYDKDEFSNHLLSCVDKEYNNFYSFIKEIYKDYNLEYSSLLKSDNNIINSSYKVNLYKSNYKRYLANGISSGDIITYRNPKTNELKKYLFYNESTMYYYNNGKISVIRGAEKVQKILDTLYVQSNVAIIRPLMMIK